MKTETSIARALITYYETNAYAHFILKNNPSFASQKKGEIMRRLLLVLMTILSLSLSAQHVVKATKYHPGGRCGVVTADGSRISKKKVENGTHRWVALSPDMFKKGYRLGDKIKVVSKNKYLCGFWIIKDKMSRKLKNRIDFLMPKNSPYFDSPCNVTIYKA